MLFTDKTTMVIEGVNVIEYDVNTEYSDRIYKCLQKVEGDTIFFHHEDMVAYDEPDKNVLNDIVDLVKNYNVDFVKLLKGGNHTDIIIEDIPVKNLYYIPLNGLSYTVQPSIWKRDSLLQIHRMCPNVSVRNIELVGSDYLNKKQDTFGLYWYAKESKRGMHHWNSRAYPNGNMISKGKWIYSEYGKELTQLHEQYKINKNTRGTI